MRESLCAMALALVLPAAAHAAGASAHVAPIDGFRFHIVTGDDSAQSRHIADDLYRRLAPLAASFRTELAQRRRLVYIAIGPAALRDAASRGDDAVVISAFTSSQVVNAVMAGAGKAGKTGAAAITAVYAEPAPADQLRLISLLYRRPVRVAAVVGAETAHLPPLLQGGAQAVGVERMAAGEDINRVLNRIAAFDALLAMPDSGVYNTDTIRNILLSTYRHKQGVIGFSADMVKAGALATTYSDIEDIDAQVAEMATAFASTGVLPPPQFPRYFSTIVNDGVARSLDLEVSDAARAFAHRPAVNAPAAAQKERAAAP